MERPKYSRLTGWRRRGVSVDSLWRTDDHLLLVQRHSFVETYRRYYFSNIQGFVVTPSSGALWIAGISGVPIAIATFVTLLVVWRVIDVPWAVFTDIFAIPWIGVFLVNWFRGATCNTHLCTAVGDIVIVPLGRQRDAQRVIPQLAELIVDVQGPLDPKSDKSAGIGVSVEAGSPKAGS